MRNKNFSPWEHHQSKKDKTGATLVCMWIFVFLFLLKKAIIINFLGVGEKNGHIPTIVKKIIQTMRREDSHCAQQSVSQLIVAQSSEVEIITLHLLVAVIMTTLLTALVVHICMVGLVGRLVCLGPCTATGTEEWIS